MLGLASEPLPDLSNTPIGVPDAAWARLMRAPSIEALGEEMKPALERVRQWATESIRPHYVTHAAMIEQIKLGSVRLACGSTLPVGGTFSNRLDHFRVDTLIVLGITLGRDTDTQVKHLWDEERFEESYLLGAYAAALTESVRSRCTQQLSRWADHQGRSLLTPEGPGYNDWPTDDLPKLYECLASAPGSDLADHMQITSSGSLKPSKSVLVVFGVTHSHNPSVSNLHEINPCSRCRLPGCTVRRVPFERRLPTRGSKPGVQR